MFSQFKEFINVDIGVYLSHFSIVRMALFWSFWSLFFWVTLHKNNRLAQYSKWGFTITLYTFIALVLEIFFLIFLKTYNFLDTFLQTWSMWNSKLNLLSSTTPRYFMYDTGSISLPFIFIAIGVGL